MNKFQSVFNEINKYINYMLYDEYILCSVYESDSMCIKEYA